ncbi:DUF4012 domain-containing protein [Plantibacter flavus]|uniref:DUF4012 domain-containing protein n=1 Tax=Plantibacter flavus TaxID=150123 RepID=UPI003F190E4D
MAQAQAVRTELLAAVPQVQELREGIETGQGLRPVDLAGVDGLGEATRRAVDHTAGFDWWVAERLPVAGANFEAVRTAAEAADVVVRDVLAPVVALPVDGLVTDGRLDVSKVGTHARTAATALETLESQVVRLQRLDRSALLPQVAEALTTVDEPLQEAASASSALTPLLRALPGILGEDGPRDVVVLFQNSAEARGLGGIAGASVLISLEDGRLTVAQTLSGADFTAHADPIVPLPADADALYRSDGYAIAGTSIHEVTTRPDFVDGARAAAAHWQESQGVTPDVVLAVDPRALSSLMRATGPVTLATGEQLTAETVVDRLVNGVYREFAGLTDAANQAQDAYFAEVVGAVVSSVQNGSVDLPGLLAAAAQSVEERRLLAWSADRVEQRGLVQAGVAGELPVGGRGVAPFGLYLSDAVGSKLEYYLQQETTLAAGACAVDGSRVVSLASRLRNTIDAEPNLADVEFDYITGLYEREGLERGQMRLRVMVYAPEDSDITSVRVDGVETPFTPGSDSGRRVAYVVVSVAPGAELLLEADATLRGSKGAELRFEGTPGVHPAPVTVTAAPCD